MPSYSQKYNCGYSTYRSLNICSTGSVRVKPIQILHLESTERIHLDPDSQSQLILGVPSQPHLLGQLGDHVRVREVDGRLEVGRGFQISANQGRRGLVRSEYTTCDTNK